MAVLLLSGALALVFMQVVLLLWLFLLLQRRQLE